MKNILKVGILLLIVSILGYLVFNVISKSKEKNAIAKQLQTIPEFQLQKLDSTNFSNSNLLPNRATIFIYFNSECDFCQHEAQSISDNLDKFNNVQFVFVSTETKAIIKQFSEHYNLHNKPNINFLHDNANLFSTQFDAKSIPYILIYNKDNALIKKQNGQLNANGILRVLNK